MHDDRTIVEDRIERILKQRIRPAVYAERIPLTLAAWEVPDEPVPVTEALRQPYERFERGTPWGRPWSTLWLRATANVPAQWAGRRVEAVFDPGFVGDWAGGQAEALVYDGDGHPIKGIEPYNTYVPVTGPEVCLFLELAANPQVLADGMRPQPFGDMATAGSDPLYTFKTADLALLDEEVFHLRLDIQVLRELMLELTLVDPRRHEILRALERCLNALDIQDVSGTAAAARAELAGALSRPAHASAHTIHAAGHAHIDSAWLWPIRETKRKTARTFANVTELAKHYPELVFAGPQAQQYAWVKENHPEIFERIRAAVRERQWVPVGGMWVEADGNLPGGEALARQLVHGKRFFLDEFGYECKGVWLPDSFGYTAAYPQIAKLAGMEWFLTQKISWNQTNAFPHHTFQWEGIDGTRIFTHFPPADTYNGSIHGEELAHAVRNFRDKGAATRSLLPFGHGDGGGGPTREMMERARRLHDLEGSPRVVVGDPGEFFAAAEAEYPDAPVWSGELYLELHRATYTSQARTKRGNRRSEHLLREAELWSAAAALHAGHAYPYDELDRLWKTVLLHQFHDILPGSSIAWVHREAEAAYTRVEDELTALTEAAQAALAGDGEHTWVFNASPRARREVVAGVLVDVPASAAVRLAPGATADPVKVDGLTVDNGIIRVAVDEDGLLTSVYDLRAGREIIAQGTRGNLLQLHTDLPNNWDAWDIDRHYRYQYTDMTSADSVTLVKGGPLVAEIRVERSFGKSRIIQTYTVAAGADRVEIDTEIDWREREKILKAAFALDVHAEREASEIQFGHVHRPTHTNTSWDAARFEVSHHRWVHLAEPGYGVAVLNDSSYGHDVSRTTRDGGGTTTTLRLSLVRAPRCPDPEADQGLHRMRYALVAGAQVREAVAGGYAMNLPLRTVKGGAAAVPDPLVTTDGDAAVIEAIKLADDRSGDVIVRLYESLGGQAATVVRPAFPIASVVETDLLERPIAEVAHDGGGVPLRLRAFQIRTLRIRPCPGLRR